MVIRRILSFIHYTSFLTCFIDGGDSAFSLSILFGKLYQTGPVCCNISIQWRINKWLATVLLQQFCNIDIGRRPRFYYHHCNYQTLHLITYNQLGKAIPLFDLFLVSSLSMLRMKLSFIRSATQLLHLLGNIFIWRYTDP